MLAQAVPPSPENMIIAALADPFGLSAFFEQTMYWTPFQKNTQLVSFSGYFLLNRSVWIAAALVLLGTTYRLFSFRSGNRKIKRNQDVSENYIQEKTYTPVLTFAKIRKARQLGLFSLIKLELSNIFKGLPFIAVMLIWVLISVTEIYSRIFEGGTYRDSQYPATYRLIELTSEGLPMLGLILIIFYSGELVWRERNLNFNGIIDTTPTANNVFFFSKYIALLILPLLLIVVSIVVSIGFQVIGNYQDFKWNQYINLFYIQGVQMIFYGILALFVQNVVSNKYIGMFLSGMLIFFLGSSLSNHIGIEYPLLKLGRTPAVLYSDMTSYGYYLKSFHWYSLYWLSLGGVLVLLAFRLWRRGVVPGFRLRMIQLFSGWKKIERFTIIGFLIVFISSGSVIFYNTNILNKYYSSNERLDLSEMYEKKFKRYDTLEELYPVDLKTEVDVYPTDKKYTVKANYILKNKSNTDVKMVLISPREPLESVYLENANLIEYDSIFKTYLFQLQSPLQPGEQLTFRYQLTVENDGFETRKSVVNNGSYILHSSFEPSLGYRPSMEIKDPEERKKRGLPKREEEVTEEMDLHEGSDNLIGRVSFETLVSTQADQTAIAPGNLVRQWTSENRNYYHYKANEKISPLLGYFSARYKTHKENHKGVKIEQYYHPGHDMNVDLITKSSKEAMDYCLQNFGTYPFDHIRIAEIPGYWPFGGQAMPGTISMVEDNLYLLDQRNASVFNLVAKRTIHEVAHQWWGHILTPKMTVGGGFFIEGLAKYTEIVVMEKHYGKGALWNLSEYSNNRYFTGRSYASTIEPPAYLSDGEGYILYGKDYTIMLALKELIGADKINQILQEIVSAYRDKEEFEIITLDFLNEVYKVTPQEYHELVDDWFKKVITYDLEIKNTSYIKLANGKYKITLDLMTKRSEAKKLGEEVPISLQEPIQIGLFQKHPKEIGVGEQPLYLESHNFNKENSQVNIIVDKLPTHVSIDPYGTRLDKNRVNNIKRL